METDATLRSTLYSIIFYLVIILVVILLPGLIFKKWQTNRKELGLSGVPTWLDIIIAPLGLFAYILIAALFTQLFSSVFPWFQADQAQDVGFDTLTTRFDLILGFISLVVISPVAEEFIFRGWLYGKLRTLLPVPLAIIIVSALFGLLHGQWNVGINVFIMSIVLCLQRELTGTIYSGILLHMLKNGIAFYLLYVAV